MKTYTRYNPTLKSTAASRGLHCDDLIEAVRRISVRDNNVDLCMKHQELLLQKRYMDGMATVIFMPDRAFCDWLVSCVPTFSICSGKAIHELSDKDCVCFVFETKSGIPAFLACIPENTMHLDGSRGPDYGTVMISFTKGSESAMCSARLSDESNSFKFRPQSEYCLKLVAGLSLYLACFPDQSVPGIPAELAHPNWFRGERTMTIDKSAVTGGDSIISPHYRMGHFRLLGSEYFKNKRGQVVFVKGCFVKADSKTIIAP